MSYTIYDCDIWERIIEKHHLKDLAMELGVLNNPQKANEMMKQYENCFGKGKLSKKEINFCSQLLMVKFTEQRFLEILVDVGTEHLSFGANDHAMASMKLALLDFESSFQDFIIECGKKGKSIETIKFSEAYEIFLNVIKLKLKYKIPYTKLFIRRLLQISPKYLKENNSLEIREYFLENNPEIIAEIIEEL